MWLKNYKKQQRKGSTKEWAQMETRGGSGIVEKKRRKRGIEKSRTWWSAEYLVVGCKVIATFTIIFKVWKRQNVQWENAICANNNSWYI
jgi:hypothetical protein